MLALCSRSRCGVDPRDKIRLTSCKVIEQGSSKRTSWACSSQRSRRQPRVLDRRGHVTVHASAKEFAGGGSAEKGQGAQELVNRQRLKLLIACADMFGAVTECHVLCTYAFSMSDLRAIRPAIGKLKPIRGNSSPFPLHLVQTCLQTTVRILLAFNSNQAKCGLCK